MKMSDIFNLPVTGREFYQHIIAGNTSPEKDRAIANCINHADALADALEAVTSDYNRYTAIHPVDMTDDDNAKLHGIMFNASQTLRLYRGAK